MADSIPLTGPIDLTSTPKARPLTLEVLHAWVTTVDHKKIGLMYIGYALVFLVIAGLEAIVMRLQLAVPENSLVSPQVFNRMFTMHGTTMVFFVGMPILFGFGNYVIPLMLRATWRSRG
jgi:heme/copper-type cytochrome/quinol oxidase subunit 1